VVKFYVVNYGVKATTTAEHALKSWELLCPFPSGELGPQLTQCAWAEAYRPP